MLTLHMTESEASTISNALRVAAERFAEHVAECQEMSGKGHLGMARLGDQFDRQMVEARRLADRIDELDDADGLTDPIVTKTADGRPQVQL